MIGLRSMKTSRPSAEWRAHIAKVRLKQILLLTKLSLLRCPEWRAHIAKVRLKLFVIRDIQFAFRQLEWRAHIAKVRLKPTIVMCRSLFDFSEWRAHIAKVRLKRSCCRLSVIMLFANEWRAHIAKVRLKQFELFATAKPLKSNANGARTSQRCD